MKNGRSGRCLRAMAMALALMIVGLGTVAESAALDVDISFIHIINQYIIKIFIS